MKAPVRDVDATQPGGSERHLLVLRCALVACQAATILISWPLWTARETPPELPALPLPSMHVGIALLVSLVLVVRYPMIGASVHAGVLVVSFAMDQTRLQPEVVSMAILLFATTGRRTLVLLGRTHLMTLWFWAGLSKLLSDRFIPDRARWMFDGLPVPSSLDGLAVYFGAAVIILEIGAGVLSLPVRTRRIGVAFAICVHLGALLTLGPLGHDWNHIIWPWNVALAVAALTLIAPWHRSVRAELSEARWLTRLAVVFLVVYPAGFYLGAADAYLSHHLYSDDTANGVVCDERGRCRRGLLLEPLETLRAPLPPEHRLFRALFDETCEPGQVLLIRDTRRWYASRDWEHIRRCPAAD